ncbi:MAG: LysM peptidoglycan-binding domain-containing protein [Clostridia bacterium]|nr:LysM peptidoglycan-binding domain-containing protein [Oscillospiraceae bacterium]MBR4893092.1 LysM peptidoglycan-binding domain-containing protein [Clostridia bacterium]
MKKIVIKNKFRFIVFLLVMFTLVSLLCVSVFNLGKVYSKTTNEYITYYVASGDTLWEIAQEYNVKNVDTRKFINEIKTVNNIGSNLYIGQEIIIPQ